MAISVCRVCLVSDIRMLKIDNTQLLAMYEKLTNTKLNTEVDNGMLDSICYVCHGLLQKCCKFCNMAHRSNIVLRELFHNGTKVTQNAVTMLSSFNINQNLSVSPTKCISIDSFSNNIPVTVTEEQVFVKKELTENVEIEIEEFKFEKLAGVAMYGGSNITELSNENMNDAKNFKCDNDLTGNGGLTRSMLVHTEEKPYSSNITDSLFLNPATIDNYSNNKSISVTFKKELVKEEITENLETELEEFEPINDVCDGSNTEASLENDNEVNNIKCDKTYTGKSGITKSMLVPSVEKPYSCKNCGKTFARKAYLKIHTVVHTGERAYSCNVCGKACSRKADLKKHIQVHTGEKPFSCDRCNKVFTRKGGLTNHMLVHSGERAYSCSECGKSFKVNSNLTRHLLTHTGERPHSCNVCGKAFSRLTYLKTHMLVHIQKKYYSCDRCTKKFTLKANLKVHIRIHNGETACYSCYRCDQTFNEMDHLTSHMLVHTRDKDQV